MDVFIYPGLLVYGLVFVFLSLFVTFAEAKYRFIEKSCPQDTIRAINGSFTEAKWLSDALTTVAKGYDFSVPHS